MKTKNRLQFICLALLCLMFACTPAKKVTYSGKQIMPANSIVLYSTMIGKVGQPVLPLIDAAAFNAKTNSIADEIINLEKKNMDNFRTIVANSLEKNFRCKIIFDESLHDLPAFSEAMSKHNQTGCLRIENDHFPLILISSDDVNPFPFENGDVVKYFKNQAESYKPIVSDICKSIDAEMLVVSYSLLNVIGVGPFGIGGNLRFDTYVYLFDNEGDLVLTGHNWSKPTGIGGKKIEEYEDQLNNYSIIIEPLMAEIAANCKTK